MSEHEGSVVTRMGDDGDPEPRNSPRSGDPAATGDRGVLEPRSSPRSGEIAKPLPKVRVGIGWDSHRLVAGRPLIIGGVTIESEAGLDGHSDADVLTHAIIDALLGAAGLGDIGTHFPDSDERWRGADSIALLRQVVALVRDAGHEIVNVDATLLLERPKIGPHRAAICERLAAALAIGPGDVNVKATTGEGIGFVGRGEGAAAQAVAMLEHAR